MALYYYHLGHNGEIMNVEHGEFSLNIQSLFNRNGGMIQIHTNAATTRDDDSVVRRPWTKDTGPCSAMTSFNIAVTGERSEIIRMMVVHHRQRRGDEDGQENRKKKKGEFHDEFYGPRRHCGDSIVRVRDIGAGHSDFEAKHMR